MSTTITNAFVQQYNDEILMLVEQGESRLRGAVRIEDFRGQNMFVERVGSVEMIQRVSRHQPTSSSRVNTPHSRRRLSVTTFEVSDLLDQADLERMLTNPLNAYSKKFANAALRRIDNTVIAAFDATVTTNDIGVAGTGATTITFANDRAGQVAAGATNLTTAKIIEAKELLDVQEVPFDGRFIMVNASAMASLLNEPGDRITSADHNITRVLVDGRIDTWLGFKFIQTELLTAGGTAAAELYAWHQDGMALTLGANDIETFIDRLPETGYSWQVFTRLTLGSVRVEGERVVQILANQS